MKKGWKAGMAVALVVALALGGYFVFRGGVGSADAEASYTTLTISTGDLEKSVSGTGTLAVADSLDVALDFEVKPSQIVVKAGQRVAKGDLLATVDAAALASAVSTLESELTSLDSQLVKMEDGYSSTETIKSTIAGRVKEIYAEAGDYTLDVIGQNGALLLLSLDGKMKVEIETDQLALGDSVTVVDGEDTYTGTVESVDGKTALVTFSDAATGVDAAVTVQAGGKTLGKGKAAVNKPVEVTGSAGTVSKVYVSQNKKVYSGTSLFYLKNVPESGEYRALLNQRQAAYETLQAARAIQQKGGIISPEDGIVSAVNTAAGQAAEAGASLFTLYVGDSLEMVVQIDELDIQDVAVGQAAAIEMDAIEDASYTGEVTEISQIGTANSGVTTYDVTIRVEGDENLKIGMNGTATIIVERRTGVVLVPLIALQTARGEQYVWLKEDAAGAESGNPGVMTVVTTGLSNDTYAEVRSGLAEGDQVVVVRSESESGERFFEIGMGGGAMAGGFVSGGQQRPEGGGQGGMPGGSRP